VAKPQTEGLRGLNPLCQSSTTYARKMDEKIWTTPGEDSLHLTAVTFYDYFTTQNCQKKPRGLFLACHCNKMYGLHFNVKFRNF